MSLIKIIKAWRPGRAGNETVITLAMRGCSREKGKRSLSLAPTAPYLPYLPSDNDEARSDFSLSVCCLITAADVRLIKSSEKQPPRKAQLGQFAHRCERLTA